MRRPPITAILTAGACALGVAAPAAAQESAGQRYLAWPTKTAAASGPAAYVANPAANPVPGAPRRRAPIIPHGGFGRMPDTAPAQNLTPASAWLGPNAPTYQPVPPPQPYPAYAAATPTRAAPQPQPQPQPVYAPAPPVAAPAPTPAPAPAPVYVAPAYVAPAPQPPVAYAPPPVTEAAPMAPPTTPVLAPPANSATSPAPTPVAAAPQPAPVPAPASEPAPGAPPAPDAPAFDPMAPRRDAPIFRLQRAAPSEPVASPSAPSPATAAPQPQAQTQVQPQAQPQPLQAAPQEGARYYSVHRQAGRQPDATPLPPAVYLDGLPVELTTPPASTDLAEPPAQPALIRNSNGRLQAAPDTEVQDQP